LVKGKGLAAKKHFHRLDLLLLFYQENGEALLSTLKINNCEKK
jgi:hypothetical protein